MIKIIVNVELYLGGKYKERVDIDISEEEIKDLAESKAFNESHCISCEARDIKYEITT